MAFLNIRFPTGISYGAVGGPGYSTAVASLNSGVESRNQNWTNSRCKYNAARGCNTDEDREALLAFFRIAKGRANSFRWKDWTDHTVETGQGTFTPNADGSYQFRKSYANSAGSEDRIIDLPIDPVVLAGASTLVLNTDYTLDLPTGTYTPLASPIAVPTAWSGEFDVLVRFDTDDLQLVAEDLDYFKSQTIPIVEIRESSA